jgi:hypothetical protein
MIRDTALESIIQDLSMIRLSVRSNLVTNDITVTFLELNHEFIDYSLEVFASMSYAHKKHYKELHRELDESALSDSFVELPKATYAKIEKFHKYPHLVQIFPIRDDEINMLQRALRYAAYVVQDHGYVPSRFINGEIQISH